MRSADPGGRAGGCIGRAPAESGTRMYCGSVAVAPAVSADAIFLKNQFFSEKTHLKQKNKVRLRVERGPLSRLDPSELCEESFQNP